MTRLINFCWFWFKWGLIACAIGAALAVPYFYQRMDNEIRCRMEEIFAKHYAGLQVKIRSAALMRGEGISVRGLSIVDPAAEGPGGELLTYDECLIACPTDLSELLHGQLQPTRVVVRRPTLRMTRRGDGTWSAAKLLPLPRLDGAMPEVRVENGTIEIFDPTKSPPCTFTLRDVNLAFTPIPPPPGMPETTRRRRVQGTATGDNFRQVSLDGEVDIDRPAVNLTGTIEGLEITPEARDALPDMQGCKLAVLASLRGESEAHFQVSYDPAAEEKWKFDVDGQLSHGRLEDPRLPHYPLTEIQAAVHVDNRGFSIRDLKARSNQTTLSLACSGGLSTASPLHLEGEISQLPLDEQLMAVLPRELRQRWDELRPEGVIDASVGLHYDGRAWRPHVKITCHNVSFAHKEFPYRLERGNGLLELLNDRLTADLFASSENQVVHLKGEIDNPLTSATGNLRLTCDALPLDEKLMAALPDKYQPLARSLELRGSAAVDLVLWQDVPDGQLHKHLVARAQWANHCSLCYSKFPVAVSNIVGQVEMVDGNWWCDNNLEGYNGTSSITGSATFLGTSKGDELNLHLTAGNVPLGRELRDALPAGMQQAWTMLQPSGNIDVVANVHYLSRGNLLDVGVRAVPRNKTCSLEPVHFPYRLDDVEGVFTYAGGKLDFERFSAWHDAVKLGCNGSCIFGADFGWQLCLDHVAVDVVRLDRQFMQFLPPQLKKNLGELNATGRISVHEGRVVVTRVGDPRKPTDARWDLPLGLNQVGLDCGVRLENIWGNVRVVGWSDGAHFGMHGEMAIEALTYRDLHLTQLMGPILIDDKKAMFGRWVAQEDNQSLPPGQKPVAPRWAVAKVFGGMIYGDGAVFMGEQPYYRLEGHLAGADLATCDRELTGKTRNLHGRISADVDLHGAGRTRKGLAGQGGFRLVEANIYELPPMVSLLKTFSLKPPDPNAFSSSDADFHIDSERIIFDKLNFNGDAISLAGKGEMNFQGEDLKMVFQTKLGRGDAGTPVVQGIRNFLAGAGRQIMQISVTGNIQDPKITQEAFPGVNQALKNSQVQ